MQGLGLLVIADSIHFSSVERKYISHPLPATISVQMVVSSTPRAWELLAAHSAITWQTESSSSSMLGFCIDNQDLTLRLRIPRTKKVSLISLLFACGYQEAEVACMLVTVLRDAGIPAMWAPFHTAVKSPSPASKRGRARTVPCNWHSLEGGVNIIFGNTQAVATALHSQLPRFDL